MKDLKIQIHNWLFPNNKNSLKRIWLKLLNCQMRHHKKSSFLNSQPNLLLWIKPSFPRSQASLVTLEFLRWEALTTQRICTRSNRRSKTKSTLWSRRLQDKVTTQAQQWLRCHLRSTRQGKVSQARQQATVALQTTLGVHPETAPRFWCHTITTFLHHSNNYNHLHLSINGTTQACHLLAEDLQLLTTPMKTIKSSKTLALTK